MRKRFGVVMLLLVVLLVTGSVSAKPIVLKYATTGPADPFAYVPYAAGLVMKQIIEARTEGEVQVEIYSASSLGNQREIIEGIQMDAIEIGSVNTAALSGWVPEVDLLSIPFLFRSERMAWEVFDGPFGKKLIDHTLQQTGLRIVGGIQSFGMRQLTNNSRPIRKPEDMKGLKFRAMDSPIFIRMFQSLGSMATPIAMAETYLALQMGTVDGQENPQQSIDSFKLYEVQKYLTLNGHTVASQVMLMNEAFLQRLSEKHRDIILEAARDATISARGLSILVNLVATETLVKEGMNVYQPSAAELDQFAQVTMGPIMEHLKTYISDEWIQALLEATDVATEGINEDYQSFMP